MKRYITIIILSIVFLSACAGDESIKPNATPESLFKDAEGYLKEDRQFKAAKTFEAIEAAFPFSPLAIKGQVRAGYAYFEDKKYRDLIFKGYTIIYKVENNEIKILDIFKWQDR